MSVLKKALEISQNKLTELVAFTFIAFFILCGTLGKDLVVDYFKNKEWSVGELRSDAFRHQKVQELITELRVKSGASRVIVSLFHNGGFYSSGVPYKKASVIYETLDFGVAPVTQESQNVPLSQISDVLTELTTKTNSFFIDTESMADGIWKYNLIKQGADNAYYCRISQGQKIIGYITVTYSQKVKENKEIEKMIDTQANFIQSYLDGWE